MTDVRRVLFVEKSFGLSGSTISLATLLEHLNGEYIPYAAVSRPEQREFLEQRVKTLAGVAVVNERRSLAKRRPWARLLALAQRYLPVVERPLLWSIGVADLFFCTMPYVLHLAWVGRRWRADLVHQNNGFDFGALVAAALLRLPMVVFQRGNEPLSLIARLFAPRVNRYVANSCATKRSLLAVGVPRERITLVHPPIDLSRFDPNGPGHVCRADLGLADDAPCFGIIGQLVDWKGHQVFLDAARRVLAAMPNASVLIVGEAPPERASYRAALEEQAVHAGISDRIHFLGFRDDVADLLRLMDVVVHASLYPEPFGRVLVEAIAMKKPVVATAAGGPLEIIEHGLTGFLVPPGDAEAMARRILELLQSPRLARRMGEAGAKSAARFDVSVHMRRVHALYAEMTSSNSLAGEDRNARRAPVRSGCGRRP